MQTEDASNNSAVVIPEDDVSAIQVETVDSEQLSQPPQTNDAEGVCSVEEQTRVLAQEKIIKLPPAKEGGAEKTLVRPSDFSDDTLALNFSKLYQNELRYVVEAGIWRRWNGSVWARDNTLFVFSKSRKFCRIVAEELAKEEHYTLAKQIASRGTVSAIEGFSRCDHRLVATIEQWDTDDWLLNTPDNMIDLQAGRFLQHDLLAYCTKMNPVSPNGGCDRWTQFLDEITDGNVELQQYLQRIAGYCLTGSTREHAIFFLYGTGANGKGVFTTTLTGIMGDYATISAIETFYDSSQDRHPTELAKLMGARLVTASETQSGRYWNETKIKLLTGGDKIAARFMRQDFFDFQPKFKLIVSGNHQPNLMNVDEAIRRRMHLIPFAVTIPVEKRDSELSNKLHMEWPGILAWAIKGCEEWQRQGLNPPKAVLEATAAYLETENTFERWISEECLLGKDKSSPAAELYHSWCEYCQNEGESTGSQKVFSQNLITRGFKPTRDSKKRAFIGIAIRPPTMQEVEL